MNANKQPGTNVSVHEYALFLPLTLSFRHAEVNVSAQAKSPAELHLGDTSVLSVLFSQEGNCLSRRIQSTHQVMGIRKHDKSQDMNSSS